MVLLSIISKILGYQLPRSFVIDLFEYFNHIITIRFILAFIQLLLESLILLLPRILILRFAELRQLEVQLLFELIFEDLHVLALIYVLVHNTLDFDQLFLIVPQHCVEIDSADDDFQMLLREDKLLLQIVVCRLNSFVKLPAHP